MISWEATGVMKLCTSDGRVMSSCAFTQLYSFREKLISHKVTRTPEAAEFCTDITMLRYLR